jgi:hypothetical protein
MSLVPADFTGLVWMLLSPEFPPTPAPTSAPTVESSDLPAVHSGLSGIEREERIGQLEVQLESLQVELDQLLTEQEESEEEEGDDDDDYEESEEEKGEDPEEEEAEEDDANLDADDDKIVLPKPDDDDEEEGISTMLGLDMCRRDHTNLEDIPPCIEFGMEVFENEHFVDYDDASDDSSLASSTTALKIAKRRKLK